MRNFTSRLNQSMSMLSESKMLEGAIIRMHRGTVIEADHVVETDHLYIVGIGYNPRIEPVKPRFADSLCRSIRAFFGPMIQDPTYRSRLNQKRNFDKILTMKKENVADIQYK